MEIINIKNNHVSIPNHACTLIMTSDGEIYLFDFTPNKEDANKETAIKITQYIKEANVPLENIEKLISNGVTIIFKNISFNDSPQIRVYPPIRGLQIQTLYNQGNELSQSGYLNEAQAAYQQIINAAPNYAYAYTNLGTILEERGLLDAALKAYQKSLQIEARDTYALRGIGRTLGKIRQKEKDTKKIEAAIQTLQEAINRNPQDALPYGELGDIFNARTIGTEKENDTDRIKNAIYYYEECIKRWNGSQKIKRMIEKEIKKLKKQY